MRAVTAALAMRALLLPALLLPALAAVRGAATVRTGRTGTGTGTHWGRDRDRDRGRERSRRCSGAGGSSPVPAEPARCPRRSLLCVPGRSGGGAARHGQRAGVPGRAGVRVPVLPSRPGLGAGNDPGGGRVREVGRCPSPGAAVMGAATSDSVPERTAQTSLPPRG